MKYNPPIIILGIDPAKHKMPPLLQHYMMKMHNDFQIVFLSEDALDERTGESMKAVLELSKFVPDKKEPKNKIIQP